MHFCRVFIMMAWLCLLSAQASALTPDGKECLASDPWREQQKTVMRCDKAIAGAGNSDIERSDLHHQRGEAYYWASRTDFAVADFDAAIALNPDAFEAQIQRGWAKLRMSDHA
jgi:lipoprotein NlpI